MLVGPEPELFLDCIELGVEERILSGQLEHPSLEQQIGDPSLFARPLGGLVVFPAPIPVGVVLARVRNELALFARAQNIAVGRLKILRQVDHAACCWCREPAACGFWPPWLVTIFEEMT